VILITLFYSWNGGGKVLHRSPQHPSSPGDEKSPTAVSAATANGFRISMGEIHGGVAKEARSTRTAFEFKISLPEDHQTEALRIRRQPQHQ